jgi:xylulokinase
LHEAESVTPRSEGLQFLPYLSGERTPYPDPLARGAFIGLALRHGRGHMTRVVLEGVAFGLKGSFALIKNAKLGEISQIRASGGATKGTLWRRILASVLEADLLTVTSTEGAAYGAALLAGMGAENWRMVPQPVEQHSRFLVPHGLIRCRWKCILDRICLSRDLYPVLKECFRMMSSFNHAQNQ